MTSFQDHQASFSGYIRNPDEKPLPDGIEARRMKIYSELFYNNVEGFIRSSFPILRQIVGDDYWHEMVRDFFIRHPCQSPYFLDISREFLSYLQDERIPQKNDPPFLFELAHYEWVELAMDVSEDEIPRQGFNPEGDLMAAAPMLSPLATVLCYQFDVHRIGSAYQPDTPPEHNTFLLVYRNSDDKVRFMEINAITARLLELMQERELLKGQELVKEIGNELPQIPADKLQGGARQALEHLRKVGVVLGTRLHSL